jgi:UDP-glucose 4-epimerase
MRIAITGFTGLLGGALARRLATAGHELVRIGRGDASDVRFDLAAGGRLPGAALRGCDALVHAAGVTDEDFLDPSAAFAKARDGAAALIEAARADGVARLAYISSAHVYGALEGVIDESRPARPISNYAKAHFETEEIFRAAVAEGVAALVARPCAVYGMPASLERFARWSLIPFDFPRQALGGRIVLKSSGAQRRNFVDSAALARRVADWLAQRQSGFVLANMPGREELSVLDFATLCARIAREELGRDCKVERPLTDGPAAANFEYRSLVGAPLEGKGLEEHVRTLTRRLSAKESS